MEKANINIAIDADLKAKFQEVAKMTNTSVTALLEEHMELVVEEYERKKNSKNVIMVAKREGEEIARAYHAKGKAKELKSFIQKMTNAISNKDDDALMACLLTVTAEAKVPSETVMLFIRKGENAFAAIAALMTAMLTINNIED